MCTLSLLGLLQYLLFFVSVFSVNGCLHTRQYFHTNEILENDFNAVCASAVTNRSVPSRGGRYGKNISIFHDFITILCHVSFNILSEQYGQTNFPIIKTKPFKVTEYKKEWWIFRPKWVKIKIFVIILSLLLKNKNKDTHYKYT